MKVAVLMGGNSSERLVSMKSGEAVVTTLKERDVDVYTCIYDGNINDYIPRLKTFDVVFLALHGGEGENGKIQEIFEREKIIYTGSKPRASALAMDKSAAKRLMVENNIPTPAWRFFDNKNTFKRQKKNELGF